MEVAARADRKKPQATGLMVSVGFSSGLAPMEHRANGDLPQHGTGTNGHANHVREASTPADVTKQPNMSQQ